MSDGSDPFAGGSPDDKINAWLELTKNDGGHLKAGDWMAALAPYLRVQSTSPSMPHPSVTFTYTVQSDHCNRLQSLHGGAAATLFDFCTTMPLALVNRPGFWQFLGVTRTLNVTYFRPARAGEEVLIECQILQIGKRLTSLRGVMTRKSDGQILSICEHGKVNIDPEPNL
ncbi:thioesterase superfamily protein [Hirsutella rhossiliensis]|uniref:Thioesterase superfamily domain-containing protein n=1 Tax=Hirsutella rhossiliensis TaxID=111463 RepID=A0A9P8SKE6_9HYPO|nr:thioesterase superfamily domain-containing protein [Hirsutella rhossiliensis]KAH0965836.1 thioesterase superfamily domain-containing protein [Hirsutella rhossiliensis]